MSQEDDKKPKKKTAPRRKTVKKKEEIETEEDIAERLFRKKIKAAIEANLMEYAVQKNLSKKQINTINGFIEEHLSCFVLLGYSVDGEPISIVNARTQQNSDALGTLLQKFLIKYIDPPGPPSQLF